MSSKIQVGLYIINTDEILGKGSFGIVYSCSNDHLKNYDLCVKVLLMIIRSFLIMGRCMLLKKYSYFKCCKKFSILI